MKKKIISLCAIISLAIGNVLNAQTVFDSIVIESFLANGGEYNRIGIYPKGVHLYNEDEMSPAISVKCNEYYAAALRKRSGAGSVYTETRQKTFILDNDLLINDNTGESYYERLISACMFILESDGNIWNSKSKKHESTAEEYDICRIFFYESFSSNRQVIISYQFEVYDSDMFRDDFLRLLKLLKEIYDIPTNFLVQGLPERR